MIHTSQTEKHSLQTEKHSLKIGQQIFVSYAQVLYILQRMQTADKNLIQNDKNLI